MLTFFCIFAQSFIVKIVLKQSVGQYIGKLMVRDHYNQSTLARELGISRQMLSYIMLNKREISLPLSLKI